MIQCELKVDGTGMEPYIRDKKIVQCRKCVHSVASFRKVENFFFNSPFFVFCL
jgi:hypothetical protein